MKGRRPYGRALEIERQIGVNAARAASAGPPFGRTAEQNALVGWIARVAWLLLQ